MQRQFSWKLTFSCRGNGDHSKNIEIRSFVNGVTIVILDIVIVDIVIVVTVTIVSIMVIVVRCAAPSRGSSLYSRDTVISQVCPFEQLDL